MAQNAEIICNPERKTGFNTKTYKVGIAGAIIGMVAYIFLVVPILTLTIVVAVFVNIVVASIYAA